MPALRDYQQRAIQQCREAMLRGRKNVLLVLPTGAGKTPTALEIMRCTVEKGKRTLFLADRIQLVMQAHERATEWGVPHGLLIAGRDMDLTRSVQIGSKDTIYARCFKNSRFDLPRFDLIVLDEAHRGQNTSALATVNANPDAYLVGLTATPAGVSGKGLGDLYQDLIVGATYSELRGLGYLVPNVVFAPTLPDLSKVKKNADGDFVGVQAEKVMQDKKIIGDVWENWNRLASGRRTLVFGTGVAHSIELRDMFRAHGVSAEHIDGGTPDDERQEHFEAFKRGYIKVLTNYGVLDTGFDAPWCGAVVIVRPTESRVLWMQMANRGGRPWDGLDENGQRIGEQKTDCIVIDHGGNVYRHGYPDEDIPWTLDTGKKIEQVVNEWRTSQGERSPIACPKCHRYRERGHVCPFCGHQSQRKGRQVDFAAGDLGLVDRGAVDQKKAAEDLGKHWRKCLARMAYMGRSCAAARALMYKESKVWIDENSAVGPRPKEHEWQMLVGDLYPGFIRRKAKV